MQKEDLKIQYQQKEKDELIEIILQLKEEISVLEYENGQLSDY